MRIGKYPQSHLVISNETSKIVIDAGMITFKSGMKPEDFAGADAYLFTHTHPDHLDPENVKAVVGDKPVFGNTDVAQALVKLGINCVAVTSGQEFNAGTFSVKAVDLPHCAMQDGSPVPPNTGFMINGVLFHPGDGDHAPMGLIAPNVALPIAGPTITLDGALQFAVDLQAKMVIPIHNDFFHADPEQFSQMAKEKGIEVRILAAGQETEI
jgi:L-ascorbate metabolism protein UlaG (beta-lactamase superfamily)